MERLDEDTVALLSRRAYDVAASTRGVKVFLNGKRIPIKVHRKLSLKSISTCLTLLNMQVYANFAPGGEIKNSNCARTIKLSRTQGRSAVFFPTNNCNE
jgi:hypothetical protein